MPAFRVGIVGGGLGGLALAHLLSKSRAGARGALAVTVFERESGPGHRHQGYNIGLNPDGLSVLARVAELGAPDLEVVIADKSCRLSSFAILDRNMTPLLRFSPPGPPGSLIDRNILRGALLSSLPDGVVRWGARVTTAADVQDAGVDLLVGADGARSAVRALVAPDLTYDDLGLTTVAGVVPLPAVPPPLLARVPEATLVRVLSSDGRSLLLMRAAAPPAVHLSAAMAAPLRQAQSGLIWGISYPGAQAAWESSGLLRFDDDALDEYAPAAKQGAVIDFCAGIARQYFHEDVVTLINATPRGAHSTYGPRQIFSVDPARVRLQLAEERRALISSSGDDAVQAPRIVLLGDAAHATTTHRGLGANTALQDAAELADALLLGADDQGVNGDWQARVDEWERSMVRRGAAVVNASRAATAMNHATGLRATVQPVIMRALDGVFGAIRWIAGFFGSAARDDVPGVRRSP